MDIAALRKIMGLSKAQVADELNISVQELFHYENTHLPPEMAREFMRVFPINPAYAEDESVDPFLPSFEQSTPSERLKSWRCEKGLSRAEAAGKLDMEEAQYAALEENPRSMVSRELGEKMEERLGVSRRWIMFGDAREAGEPLRTHREEQSRDETIRAIEAIEKDETGRRTPAERIRAAREAAGLTKTELARILSLSGARVYAMENGHVTEAHATEVISRLKSVLLGNDAEKQEATAAPVAASDLSWIDDVMLDPGERVRKARMAAGLTLEQAGAILGVSGQRVSAMEHGKIPLERSKTVAAKLLKGASQHV